MPLPHRLPTPPVYVDDSAEQFRRDGTLTQLLEYSFVAVRVTEEGQTRPSLCELGDT